MRDDRTLRRHRRHRRGPLTPSLLAALLLTGAASGLLGGCGSGSAGDGDAPEGAAEKGAAATVAVPAVPGLPGLPALDLGALEPALATRLGERLAAVGERPDSGAAWGRLGVTLDVHEMFPEAITCYERTEELEPHEYLWPYLLGNCRRLGDRAGALAHFRRAAELRQDHAPVHFHIGDLLLLDGDLDDAEAALRRALELDETLVAAHLALAKVALERGDTAGALAALEQAETLGTRTGEVHALLAEVARRQGDEAAAAAREAQAGVDWMPEPVADPERQRTWWDEGVTLEWRRRRSQVHAQRGELAKFVAEWEAAMRDDPDSAEPHVELGRAYASVRNLEKSRESYARALELDPDNAAAHLELGVTLIRMQRAEEAVAELERALELDPGLHEARGNLGAVLIQLGRPDEGLAQLRRTCEELPNSANAQINLGLSLRQLGHRTEAAEAFQRALIIDPGHARARFERAILFGSMELYEQAATEFEQLIALEPERASIYANLGLVYQQLGRNADAIATYRAGLEHGPKNVALLAALTWLLATGEDANLRDGREAVRHGKQLNSLEDYGNPFHLDILAAACAEAGDFAPAVRYASKAVDLMLHPAGPGAQGQWGDRINAMQQRLVLYEQDLPYREGAKEGG